VAQYLPDTSAWNRSTAVAEKWAELLEANEVAICTPVRLELLSSARGRREFRELGEDLALFPYLPLDARVAALAERTQAALGASSQHRGPTPTDLLVAAIAEASGVTVLHYDRHFDAIARVTGQPSEWIARRGSLD
jgi:predicted nucleic acid-binding protein